MSDHDDSARKSAAPRTLKAIAEQLASYVINLLTPSFSSPMRLVCPSDEAEQAVIHAMTHTAVAHGIPIEVVDLRPAPAERLDAVATDPARVRRLG